MDHGGVLKWGYPNSWMVYSGTHPIKNILFSLGMGLLTDHLSGMTLHLQTKKWGFAVRVLTATWLYQSSETVEWFSLALSLGVSPFRDPIRSTNPPADGRGRRQGRNAINVKVLGIFASLLAEYSQPRLGVFYGGTTLGILAGEWCGNVPNIYPQLLRV